MSTTDSRWATFAGGVALGSVLVAGSAYVAFKVAARSHQQAEARDAFKLANNKRRSMRYVSVSPACFFFQTPSHRLTPPAPVPLQRPS